MGFWDWLTTGSSGSSSSTPPAGSAASGNYSAIGGAAIGGLVDIGTSVGAGLFNAAQSAKQMKFQEKMYRTRYSMTMEDMKNAGINPILAAGGGLGGPGAGPAGSAAAMAPAQGAGGKGVASALQARQLTAQLKNIDADTSLKNNQSGVALMQQVLTSQRASSELQNTFGMRIQNRASALGLVKQSADAAWFKSNLGQFMNKLEHGMRPIGAMTGAGGNLFRNLRSRPKQRTRSRTRFGTGFSNTDYGYE